MARQNSVRRILTGSRARPADQAREAARLAAATVPPARWSRLRMWQRFFLSQVTVFTTLTVILSAVQWASLTARTQKEFGDRALIVSRTLANTPTVLNYFTQPETALPIDPLLERTRQDIGADFLVVGGRLGMRYAHPFPPELAARIDAQPGSDDVLSNGDPVEVGVQQFRDFIWGKADIRIADEVIGVVSTGFLLPTVQAGIVRVMRGLLPWYGAGLVFALLSSLYLSRKLRRDLFDLEPDQIAGLMSQHYGVLSALQEGVVVVERDAVILANARALTHLNGVTVASLLPLRQLWPELHLLLAEEGESVLRDQPIAWKGHPMLISRYPLPAAQQVVLFRERAEAIKLAEELTQTRQYVELLRSQTHEFNNRLHTIAGLIQLNRSDLALGIIQHESAEAQHLSDCVRRFASPRLAALLVGKIARARELGVTLQLDPASALADYWPEEVIDALVLCLGNLIENAFDAVAKQSHPAVSVLVGEDQDGVQAEVRDNGPGISAEHLPHLATRGFSTKGAGRGQGLALVSQQLRPLQGKWQQLRFQDETVFIVSIPPPLERLQ